MPSCFTTPDHRVWLLTRDYVDIHGTVWHWDGSPFDPAAGPEMVSYDHPLLYMPLVGLAAHCGLHSDTTEAVAHGALVEQDHDLTEAGGGHRG